MLTMTNSGSNEGQLQVSAGGRRSLGLLLPSPCATAYSPVSSTRQGGRGQRQNNPAVVGAAQVHSAASGDRVPRPRSPAGLDPVLLASCRSPSAAPPGFDKHLGRRGPM